jgi:hypothetical protein
MNNLYLFYLVLILSLGVKAQTRQPADVEGLVGSEDVGQMSA